MLMVPSSAPSVTQRAARALSRQWPDMLAAGLRILGWLAVSLLCTLGVVALAFLVLGNLTISGTMLQLSNLTTRYVAADADRQGQFNQILEIGSILVFFSVAYFRRGSAARAILFERSNHE